MAGGCAMISARKSRFGVIGAGFLGLGFLTVGVLILLRPG